MIRVVSRFVVYARNSEDRSNECNAIKLMRVPNVRLFGSLVLLPLGFSMEL